MKKTFFLFFAMVLSCAFSADAALVNRGGGLIYDTVLDVTWLQDANYAKTSGDDDDGQMTWEQAKTWTAELSFYDSVRNKTWSDWRLPAVEPVNGSSFNFGWAFDGSTDEGYNITSPNSELMYMYYANLGNPGAYLPTPTRPADPTLVIRIGENLTLRNLLTFLAAITGQEFRRIQTIYWLPITLPGHRVQMRQTELVLHGRFVTVMF